MDLSQFIDPNNTLLVVLGCVCLCGVGIILVAGLNFIGGFIDIFTSIIGVFFDIVTGGPVSWCGCFVFIFFCAGAAVMVYLLLQALATCGTPQAINLCSFFGQ
ncbi:MAG: hypothetical protein CL610_09310 [Anaerolineaceae bacterium]|nr:hypothetical protein [Anaerolineaceae bacterium]